MRGALLIGLVVVSLLIGLLVIINMGVDNPGSVQESQAEAHIEKAKSAADDVDKRFKDISKRAHGAD